MKSVLGESEGSDTHTDITHTDITRTHVLINTPTHTLTNTRTQTQTQTFLLFNDSAAAEIT